MKKSNLNGCIFSGTNRYFQRVATELGLKVDFADCTHPEKLKAALKPNTKVCEGNKLIKVAGCVTKLTDRFQKY